MVFVLGTILISIYTDVLNDIMEIYIYIYTHIIATVTSDLDCLQADVRNVVVCFISVCWEDLLSTMKLFPTTV